MIPEELRPAPAPTVKDVASLAGVSRQTVSNVLNAPERVRPATKRRVEQAIDTLGYRPHRMARNLKSQRTRMLGYRVPDADHGAINPVLDRFLHALTDSARVEGYHVLLFTPEDGQSEIGAIEEMIATRTVDGFVLAETNYRDPRICYLQERRVAYAVFGRSGLAFPHPWADVDNEVGTHRAVLHLVDRGRRRIAFVGWPEGSLTGDQRYLGYLNGLVEAGLAADSALDVRGSDAVATGLKAGRRWFGSPAPPDGIVAASDLIATGLLRAAAGAGITAGADVAICGFDDTPLAAHLTPALTSVRQPLDAVAAHVVRLLVARIRGHQPPPAGVLLAPDLVVRAST